MYYPLKFEPEYKKYIWGGRNFESLGKILPEGNIAESWEVSCQKDGVSTIANGIFKGLTLLELIKRTGSTVTGSDFEQKGKMGFPLLFKLIDANEKLSVQVHPDDQYAYIHENKDSGKHEAWYVVYAKAGAQIVYSVIPGVDKDCFAKAIKQNKVISYLNFINVFTGDVINICPGILHAIGEGIVIAEIQQNSNITYRVFDYDRVDEKGIKRPLQLEKAMDVINFDTAANKIKYEGLDVQIDKNSIMTYKLANDYFSVEILKADGNIDQVANGSRFFIYFVIDGKATVYHQNGCTSLGKGESMLIPASMGKYSLSGKFTVLKTYVPNMEQNILLPLIAAHYSSKAIFENVVAVPIHYSNKDERK